MCGLSKKLDQDNDSEWEHSFSTLLELAADNDVEGFKKQLTDTTCINQIGLWYRRQRFIRRMALEERTPLMVASIYGSVDVVKFILSLPEVELNLSCGIDKSTALHCAASGASVNSLDVVKLLVNAGGDTNVTDAYGNRPVDVLVVSPNGSRTILEEILKKDDASSCSLGSSSRSLSSSPDNSSSLLSLDSPTKPNGKEYPMDPSLPDIKSGIYSTDEFRMFSFKIRPCSRAYSHDWTECPFAHPGENAKRRDPRKFHYTCVPCPEFKKGSCKQGDMCEYAHGVFECWLHPGQYRTRLCKDGTSCNRRVCFFAHMNEELRPLYASTGSGLPSPRSSSTSTMDMASVLNMLPGSPHSYTPPISPSGNGVWSQQNIPALQLPGSNLQLSRLRSSLNARDIPCEQQLSMLREFEMQMHSSPRFSDQLAGSSVLSPSHKSALLNQLQNKQNMLSPIKTNLVDHQQHSLMQQVSSPRAVEPISPMNSRMRQQQQQQLHSRSLSSRDFGLPTESGSPLSPWSSWDQNRSNKVDWSVQTDELGRLRKSHSLVNNNQNREVEWASPRNMNGARPFVQGGGSSVNPHNENDILDVWLERLHMDR